MDNGYGPIEMNNSNENFNNQTKSSNFRVNKLNQNKSKLKGTYSTHYGRNELVDADTYYNVRDENTQLKQTINDLNDKLRKLSKYQNGKTNSSLDNAEIETLKIEIQNLKNKNQKMKTVINGLQNDLKKRKGKVTTTTTTKYNINMKSTKGFLPTEIEKSDYLEHITYLQQALKIKYDENQKLLNQLRDRDEVKTSQRITQYSKDLSDKNLKLSEITMKYDKIVTQFETNVKILELTKQSLQEYIEKYTEERNKNRDLENQIVLNQEAVDKCAEYVNIIEEYKQKEILLEQRINDLCENPFIKQANERDKAFVNLREKEIALSELQRRYEIDKEKLLQCENTIKDLQNKIKELTDERDKYKEDGLRYKLANEEKEKQKKEFQDQFQRLGQFGEIDSNFNKLVSTLQPYDENGTWSKMNFIEKLDDIPEEKEQLVSEIKRLKIEKGVLGEELEKLKNQLEIQQQIVDDLKKVQDIDQKKYKLEITRLQSKINELLSLIDKNRIPREYLENKQKQEIDNLAQNLDPNANKINESKNNLDVILDDRITEFSNNYSESDFGINENALDICITQSTFDSTVIENKLNRPSNDLLTFISVDFYMHETQTSNLITGPLPNYRFQLTFNVDVNEHFINYINGDYIIIQLYYLNRNKQIIFATGKIPLMQLAKAEFNSKSRVVRGLVDLFYIHDSNVKIGNIKYKMRMRNSIKSILQWKEDQNKIISQMSPVNDFNLGLNKKLLDSQNENIDYKYIDIDSKVYNVNIFINKAENLKVLGPPRKINPYIYYKFYKQTEHYSNISTGYDPDFKDSTLYTIIYNSVFINYIEKEKFDIYIFDDSRQIEVDVGQEVSLVESTDKSDLIGICSIELKPLLMKDLIEGKFPIYTDDGQNLVGYLYINIFWEELNIYDKKIINLGGDKNDKLQGIDPLLIKLASLLRNKGYYMDSAFDFFDREKKGNINLVDFKTTIWDILKFLDNQNDLNKLSNCVFKDKVKIDRKDFYQVFEGLLNFESDANKIKDNDENKDKVNSSQNIDNINKLNSNINDSVNQINRGNNDSMNISRSLQQIGYQSDNNNLYDSTNNQFKDNNELSFGRSTDDIMKLANDFLIVFGKNTPIDLYKMFDQDADLKVGKKEMANGFSMLGIILSPSELQLIWDEITKNDKSKQKFSYNEFKEFYNNHNYNDK